MKELEKLRWVPRWVSLLGCVKGCLNYLDVEVSDAWLYGATGHAFVLNISDDLCPSGPTAWNDEMVYVLGRNVGYVTEGVFGWKGRGELRGAQERAWELVRRSIDKGTPCYGWELGVPEFYVVYGYDDVGYYYSGPECDDGMGPKPWRELGDTGIGCVAMHAVTSREPANDATTVREALSFAREIGCGPSRWILQNYTGGLGGYDSWIRSFESGRASRFGIGYNVAVWSDCRRMAVEFLEEAKGRLDGRLGGLLDEAIAHYNTVAEALALISKAYPFSVENSMDPVDVDSLSEEAVRTLKKAREAEEAGLEVFGRIVEGIESHARV